MLVRELFRESSKNGEIPADVAKGWGDLVRKTSAVFSLERVSYTGKPRAGASAGGTVLLEPVILNSLLMEGVLVEELTDVIVTPLAKKADSFFLDWLRNEAKERQCHEVVYGLPYDPLGFSDAEVRSRSTDKSVFQKTILVAANFFNTAPGQRFPGLTIRMEWRPSVALRGAERVVVVDELAGKMDYDFHFGIDMSDPSNPSLRAIAYLDLSKVTFARVDELFTI